LERSFNNRGNCSRRNRNSLVFFWGAKLTDAKLLEYILKDLADIVELAEGSVERMQHDVQRVQEGKPFKSMDLFYFFAWYGDCIEARGQLAVAVRSMPSREVESLWKRAVEAHSKACDLRAKLSELLLP